MKKTYMQPRVEAIDFELEGVMTAVSGVNGVEGLDVTFSSANPTNFAKDHDSLWDLDEEE
jgi:purine nucleoside permease